MSPPGGHPGQRGATLKTGSWGLGVVRQLQSREGQSHLLPAGLACHRSQEGAASWVKASVTWSWVQVVSCPFQLPPPCVFRAPPCLHHHLLSCPLGHHPTPLRPLLLRAPKSLRCSSPGPPPPQRPCPADW